MNLLFSLLFFLDPSSPDGLRGLALIFNPSDASEVRQPLELPLYYTGLTRSADLEVTLDTQGQEEENGGSVVTRRFRARLDREFNVLLHIGWLYVYQYGTSTVA